MSIDSSTAADRALPTTEPQLVPVLDGRWIFTPRHLAVTAAFCALILLLNHIPLRNTDLWGHAAFGNYILDHHRLPTVDAMQPLSEGMRVVDVHWLSQTVFAYVDRLGGPEALVSLFTFVVAAGYVVLARTMYLQTASTVAAALTTGLVLVVGWNRVATIRPENFAMLLFAVTLWLMLGRRVRRDDSVLADDVRGDWKLWIGLPVVGLLWGNLHGSFPLLIATLGCFALGRILEVLRAERSPIAVLQDREVRRLVVWTELAFAATLVNPYGIDSWIEAVRFSSNPNLRDILEWNPLQFFGPGGREFAGACVLLLFAWRHSRRPIATADVLLLAMFGLGAVMQIRMTGWFAFVWGVTIAPHLTDAVRKLFLPKVATDEDAETGELAAPSDADRPALRYGYTLACVGLVWITFAFSTLSRPLLGGTPRSAEALYGATTPLRVTEWLKTAKIEGQVHNPQHWGDWLGRNVPSLKLFATTNVHLLPRSAWNDYQRIYRADLGWDVTADRYAVRAIIVDRKEEPTLARALRTHADWTQVYEDDQAAVYRRKVPSPSPTSAPVAVEKN